jgi:hypothetical protein
MTAKVRAPWYRKKLNSQNVGAFAALPCPPAELPTSLRTKRWTPDSPDWEDRPRDPADPNAATPFRPPSSVGFDPTAELPLPIEEE